MTLASARNRVNANDWAAMGVAMVTLLSGIYDGYSTPS
jgi:hypothetical protein